MPDVKIDISASSREFTTAVQQINSSVAGMRASVERSVAGMSSSFGGVIGQFALLGTAINQTLSAVRKFSSALTEAWEGATQFQYASTRLAPLVGGLTNARELCEALRESAINGTASFEELTAVATKLSSVFKNTRDIETWTKRFHDLSAGTGADMSRIVSQFTRAMASGTFNSAFLDQLSMRGVNIYSAIAEQTGMAENELKKLAQTGQLSFSQIESALISLTSGTGQFAGASQRMSETAGGSWRTLQAQISATLAKLAEPIADAITPIIQSISRTVADLAETAEGMGRAVASAISFISSNSTTATLALGGLVGALLGATGIAPRITASFAQMWASLRTQTASLGSVWSATMASMRATATAGFMAIRIAGVACLTALKSAIASTGIGIAFVAIGEAIGYAYGKFTEFREEGKELERVGRSIAQAYQDIDEMAGNSTGVVSQAEVVSRLQALQQDIKSQLEAQGNENDKIRAYLQDQLTLTTQRLGVEEARLQTMREQNAIDEQATRNAQAKAKYEAEVADQLEKEKPLREQIQNLEEKKGQTEYESEEYFQIQRQIDALQKRVDLEDQITEQKKEQARQAEIQTHQAWVENRERQQQLADWQDMAVSDPDKAKREQRHWEDTALRANQNNDMALYRTATEYAETLARIIEKAEADQKKRETDAERESITAEQQAVTDAQRGMGSTVSSSQASVGGGVSMNIGQDLMTSLQKQSVSLQQRMADLLDRIAENTQSQNLISTLG